MAERAPHEPWMRRALHEARRGWGMTSPNPMVGAVIVRSGAWIASGWHRRAGLPHAEIEAIQDAARNGKSVRGATLYVTLEPCSTQGRTPPCTEAIVRAGIRRVVVGAVDPNPKHSGKGLEWLRRRGVAVVQEILADECRCLNEPFNHWIVTGRPFVTIKSAMSLDGKIATASGDSRWITSEKSRTAARKLRAEADAIVIGVNTLIQDNPRLLLDKHDRWVSAGKTWRRIILDSQARTPPGCALVSDEYSDSTLVVVSKSAPARRVAALEKRVEVWRLPEVRSRIDLRGLVRRLGAKGISHLWVEGGGEIHAAFLSARLVHRVRFFYAPKILGGHEARPAVGGLGGQTVADAIRLENPTWTLSGPDLCLTARVIS